MSRKQHRKHIQNVEAIHRMNAEHRFTEYWDKTVKGLDMSDAPAELVKLHKQIFELQENVEALDPDEVRLFADAVEKAAAEDKRAEQERINKAIADAREAAEKAAATAPGLRHRVP